MTISQSIVTCGVISTLILPGTTFASSRDQDQRDEHRKADISALVMAGNSHHVKSLTGRVISLSGTMIKLLAANGGNFDIDTSGAKINRRYGAVMPVTDIQVNDTLEVKGERDNATSTLIHAKHIQDLSLQARNGDFRGTVLSLTGTTFVLQSVNRGMQTVLTNEHTLIKMDGTSSSFSNITIGASVKVIGAWNRTNNNVTAKEIHVNQYPVAINVHGTLQSKNGTLLTIQGKNGVSYTVNAASSTVVLRNNVASNLSELSIGNLVEIKGKHAFGSSMIIAQRVRNLSLPARIETQKMSLQQVTLAQNNQTLTLHPNNLFLLRLGEGYAWTVQVQDVNVLKRIDSGLSLSGIQGMFQAMATGTTALVATGDPLCRQATPTPCTSPSQSFTLNVKVQ